MTGSCWWKISRRGLFDAVFGTEQSKLGSPQGCGGVLRDAGESSGMRGSHQGCGRVSLGCVLAQAAVSPALHTGSTAAGSPSSTPTLQFKTTSEINGYRTVPRTYLPVLMRIRILLCHFDAGPVRIRVLLVTLTRIWIRILPFPLMRIRILTSK